MTEREKFEAAVVAEQGTHGMLGILRRDTNGEYMSACERSAWWGWQKAHAAAQPAYDMKLIGFVDGIIKDAMRYRLLRQHHKNDQPAKGAPYALAWDREDGKVTGTSPRYMREGELDSTTLDSIMCDPAKRAEYDALFDKLYALVAS